MRGVDRSACQPQSLAGRLVSVTFFIALVAGACDRQPPPRPKAYFTDASFTDDTGRFYLTLRDGTVGDTLYQQLDPPGKGVVFDTFDRSLGLPRDSDRRLCDSILSLPPWRSGVLDQLPEPVRPQYARILGPDTALTLTKIKLPPFQGDCRGAEGVYEELFGERYSLRLWVEERTATELTVDPEYAGPYFCTSPRTESVAVAADDGRNVVWLAITTVTRNSDGVRERVTDRYYFSADELKRLSDSLAEGGDAIHIQAINVTQVAGFGGEVRIPAAKSQHTAVAVAAVGALLGMTLLVCLPYRKLKYKAGDKVSV